MQIFKCSGCKRDLSVYSAGCFIVCPFCRTKNHIELEKPSWKEAAYKDVRTCPVCREDGSLVLNTKGTNWKCLNCGYSITPKKLKEEIFWFCDSCDAFMNVQPGFENNTGKWICLQCGFENDTTEENIFD